MRGESCKYDHGFDAVVVDANGSQIHLPGRVPTNGPPGRPPMLPLVPPGLPAPPHIGTLGGRPLPLTRPPLHTSTAGELGACV